MPYVNIPESSLSTGLSKILGRIKADLKIKISREIITLERSILNNCNNIDELEKLKPFVQNLQKTVVNYKNRLLKIQNITSTLTPTVVSLNVILRILLTLPIPNTTTTAGSVITLGNQLHRIKELVKQLQDDIGVISILIVGTGSGAVKGINTLILNTENALARVNTQLQTCIRQSSFTQEDIIIQDDNKSTAFLEKEKYTSLKTGETFEIQVLIVDESKIAPLRQAVAKDIIGNIRFESDKSFSSSTQVLVDQVKYYIEANIN